MKNVVYLFGAGASKDFGLPLGNEIFDHAYRLLRAKALPRIAPGLKEVLREVEGCLRRIFTNVPDKKMAYPPFEEVLTFLWDCKKLERWDYDKHKLISLFPNKRGVKEVFDVFVEMLGLTLAASMRLHPRKGRIRTFVEFVQFIIASGESPSFISLNYDTILDHALMECVNRQAIDDYTYGVPLYDINSRRDIFNPPQNMCRRAGILLLKPHGSLNLVACPHRHGDGFFYGGDDLIATQVKKLRCPSCGRVPKPLVIPPLYNKADYIAANAVKNPTINFRSTAENYRMNVDYRIREVLGTANEITVIGYSLPAYDYDFKTLLMASLMRNGGRRTLPLRIISKGNKHQVGGLKAQFERVAGSVVIEGSNGFYDYLKKRGFAKRRFN
jgi:hypothetical protein